MPPRWRSIRNRSTRVSYFTFDWIFAGGTSYNVSVEEYLGAIDDIRFFERSLDGDEINLLYQQRL